MKMFTKEVRGSISLFLSAIILMLVILEGFLIDGSKVLAAKTFMSNAGDLSLNAGLTYYDDALREIYGLFAMSETEEELSANLKTYFQATLGESVGSSDGEYVDQLLGYVQTAIQSGWDGAEAGKLLDLTLEGGSFSAKGVEGSALSETYVIKNQILEYMKYRGPASLGYGMLEKIYVFKDLDKQQKTMEAKLDYEETMSDVQKACEKAYENLVVYNEYLDNQLKPSHLEEESREINKEIYEASVAAWCYSAVKRDPQVDPDWENGIHGSETGYHDVREAASRCTLAPAMSAEYSAMVSELEGDFGSHPSAAMRAVKLMIGFKEERENYRATAQAWENYVLYYQKAMKELEEELDGLDEDEDEGEIEAIEEEMEELEKERYGYEEDGRKIKGFEEIYKDMREAANQYKTAVNVAALVLENDIDTRMQDAVTRLNKIAEDAEKVRILGTNGKSSLDDVLSSMNNLESKGQAWQNSINNLSAGEVKTSMQSDYSNKSEKLDKEKIRTLQEKLSNGIAYAETIKKAAEQAKAVDNKLFRGEKSRYYPYMKSKLESSPSGGETLPYNGTSYRDFSVAVWVGNANKSGILSDIAYTVYFDTVENSTGTTPPTMNLSVYTSQMDQSISGKNDEFFKYLERICPKTEAEEEDSSKAKEEKKKLFDKAQFDMSPGESLPTLEAAEGGSGAPGFTETDSNADDKKVSKNAKNNSKGSSNFLSGVGQLLVKGRDKLYLAEYATKMFSYYTIDKTDSNNKTRNQKNLSGYPMSAENNVMYKAEVEYILWGNPSGKKDVEYTLTTIFGIRFLLNSIYAFTGDPEIRQITLALATSIAGWTGFGVPLVQSVLIIGFALAETALDMKEIKDGKSVPIYKSTSNWQIKPSALTKEAIGQAINDAGSAAKDYLFAQLDQLTEDTKDVFKNKLESFANETVDNLVSTASAAVIAPVQERLIGLVNVVTPDREKIRSEIKEAVNGLKSSVQSEPDSALKEVKLAAISAFETQGINSVISAIEEVQNSETLSNWDIAKKINDRMKECQNTIETKIRSVADRAVKAARSEVDTALDSANENLQKNVSEGVDKMLMRIDCGVSFAELPEGGAGSAGGQGRISGSAALTMNYEEYLWLFIAVKSVQSEEDMLKRIGTLIEANLSRSSSKPSPDFTIAGAYTFIEIDATAQLTTTFFSMPVPVKGGGSVTLGNDKYSIGYHGVLGY